MLAFIGISASFAQNRAALVRQVRVMEADETSLTNPAGLAFSARANAFQVVEAPGAAQLAPGVTDVIQVTPFAHEAGSARIAAQVKDPINMAFDNKGNRLLILQFPANILIEVSQDDAGNLDPATLARHDGRGFGLEDPQGMSIDPASGTLFILDASGPRVVRIEPEADGSFDNAAIAVVSLERAGVVDVRGLAFDPATGHLHMASSSGRQLYELTQAGEVVARRDLWGDGRPVDRGKYGAAKLRPDRGIVFHGTGGTGSELIQLCVDSNHRYGCLLAAQPGPLGTGLPDSRQYPRDVRWRSRRNRGWNHPLSRGQRVGNDLERGRGAHRQYIQSGAERGSHDERTDRSGLEPSRWALFLYR
ncbi:MAG: hypothetical protein P8186_19990 [Anaerolineae bacterium]